MGNLQFALADGMALPFPGGTFDLVLSHAVIEHVADAPRYLRECARVLAAGGRVYLSTAPYLSFAGAHLPRLKIPVPLHLIAGRTLAFSTFRMLARRAPWTLKEPAHENSFIRAAQRGEVKHDDLLEKVTVASLRGQIAGAGLRIVREELHVTGTVRRLPAPLARWLRDTRATQDVLISNMEYVLARADDRTGGGDAGRSVMFRG
jgi:SAM-dependent methyltransferase